MSKKQVVEEIHKQARKNFKRRRFIQKGLNDTWQIDLVEMIPYHTLNKGFRYLLTIIDTFSKYAYVLPVKTKSAIDIVNAMSIVLKNVSQTPKNIQSDQGKEFFNKQFQQLMNKYDINHYHTFTHLKASICERFNRTLKNKMWKMFSMQGNFKWIHILKSLVDEYNNTWHRTIKMKPNEINKKNEHLLLKEIYNFPKMFPKPKFKIGEHVRISKYKGVFFKGYEPNWTTEIFEIHMVKITNPITYYLKDYKDNIINGSFYEFELQKVMDKNAYLIENIVKRKGSEVLEKWLGFDETHNSWIKKNQLLK
jgi:hypothetical protein